MTHPLRFGLLYPVPDDCFVASLPAEIAHKEDLLHHLAEVLRFPGFFGQNWDALHDCLGDLSWIEKPNVALIHRDLPQLEAAELSTYLEILSTAVNQSQQSMGHDSRKLIVYFPEACRPVVDRILASHTST